MRAPARGDLEVVVARPAVASGAAFLLLGLLTPRPGTRFLVASALGFGLRMVALWRGWKMGAIRGVWRRAKD